MPDCSRETVSASQVPALFNVSPYATEWMLYQWFTHDDWPEKDMDERMEAGVYLEPAILRWTADRLRLEVTPNEAQQYVKNDVLMLGTTLDATVNDPQRGPGVVEAKNVDWMRWRDTWTEVAAPKHIELQVQAELAATGYSWAVIACLVGGNELLLYEREPMPAVQEQIREVVHTFLRRVRGELPPPRATGSPLELPGLDWLYPEVEPGRVISTEDTEALVIYERWQQAKERANVWKKTADGLRAQLLDLAEDAECVQAPGITLRIKKTRIAESVTTRAAHSRVTISGQERMLGGEGEPDYSGMVEQLKDLYGGRADG